MNDASISTRPITDLLTDKEGHPTHFWIPAYQRGYRWKRLQVTQLLDDVWEFIQDSGEGKKQSFYCLQPIVIKAHQDGRFEIVDGQQRLTTIYILLTYLNNHNKMPDYPGKTRFRLTFETRGETNDAFLADINLERADENIDFFHICEAYRAIEDWFSRRDGNHKLELFLNDDEVGKNVKVIWFQLSDTEEAVDAFTRLNVGKIPLTNDELIRALFLRRKDVAEPDSKALQLRIAHEWDQLEKSLQSDSFWYFVSNEAGPKQNRIGFLFEFVAKADGLPEVAKHDPYEIFHAYNLKLKNGQTSLKNEWLRIKQAYMMLEEWYEDRTLYHITGFLIQQGVSIAELRKLSESNTKSDFQQELRQKIFSRVIGLESLIDMNDEDIAERIRDWLENLEYGKHNSNIRALLLLFNVATLLDNPKSNIRFQFDSFKKEKWDIEHVRSVIQDQPQRPHVQVEWLKNCLDWFQLQNNNQELKQDINSFISLRQNERGDDEFETLYKRVLTEFKEADEQKGGHSIANLTLLDQKTNRSYKNAVFAVKRQRILSLDREGTFIPLCTRNVFLKCYSPQVSNLIFWADNDQKGYQTAIEKTLIRFFKPENGKSHE